MQLVGKILERLEQATLQSFLSFLPAARALPLYCLRLSLLGPHASLRCPTAQGSRFPDSEGGRRRQQTFRNASEDIAPARMESPLAVRPEQQSLML